MKLNRESVYQVAHAVGYFATKAMWWLISFAVIHTILFRIIH